MKSMENNGKERGKKMEKCVLHEKVSKSDVHDVSIFFVHTIQCIQYRSNQMLHVDYI